MADMQKGGRPLSPFMLGKYYRIQLTSASSLLTRISGNALIAGAVLLVWWLLGLAMGPDWFGPVHWVVTSWIGRLIIVGSTWALWYHLLAGARHLIFDQGYGLKIQTAERLGWAAVIGSFVLTALTVGLFWLI
ncbi:succinate dehydrogenase, cytochrome b556 subunit [Ketogulonicigenium vulgare]|uniref:succinate dehydrogenase, cytochrome b556 subunit n=1 Tax=Ketogulonicigenium vulgare TaxID=92945 RepID=UPI002359BFE0|nr:succinate dehydrogenase, cytochrome b556 subunit [Ketogulonicigenium vulgare]